MKKFKILSKETLIDSPYCPVEKHIVEFPDGETGEWFVNTSVASVIVIPITKDGKIILQRSYKHGCREEVVEFCAGMVDEGEEPLAAAKRELQEETGFSSEKFEKIGECFANATGSTMKYSFFIARECIETGAQDLDLSEQIEVFLVDDWEAAKQLLTSRETTTSSPAISAVGFGDKYLL